MKALFHKLSLTPSNEIPMLFPGTDYNGLGDTAFDIAVKSPQIQTWIVESFLELILRIDNKGLMYSSIIDRNLK